MILKSHVESGREMLVDHDVLGLAADGGLILGLSLHNTIILTLVSQAVLACPQASDSESKNLKT